MKKLFVFALFAILIVSAMFFIACSEEEEEPERMAMPSEATMDADFSAFTESSLYRLDPVDGEERCAHFDTAAVIVTVWAGLIDLYFALPKAAFAWAISREPVYEGDMLWRWTSNNILGVQVELTGEIVEADSVEWKMFVTNAELTDFLWYEGKCDFHAEGGWWQFYEDTAGTSVPAIFAEWNSNAGDTTASLMMTNVKLGHEGYGDSLYYDLEGANAHAWLNDVDGERGRWVFDWDVNDYHGSIIYPEGTTACWDDSLQCIPCP